MHGSQGNDTSPGPAVPRPAARPALSARRRWLFRLASPLLLLLLLLGMDRLLNVLWYLPTYSDDFAPPGQLRGDRPPNKDFLRYVPDPLLGWRYHPDTTIHMEVFAINGDQLKYDLKTNALGLRSPPLRREKAPGTLRIVSVGGSSTMAPGVPLEQTYIHQLARLIARDFPGHKVESINAGVDGYGSMHGYLQYYRDLRPLKPDLLVVAYDVNDFARPYTRAEAAAWTRPEDADQQLAQHAAPDEPFGRLKELLAQKPYVWDKVPWVYESGWYFTLAYLRRWLRDQFTGPPAPPTEDQRPTGNLMPEPVRCKPQRDIVAFARPWDVHLHRYRHNLAALASFCAEDGVPMIFLSIPMFRDENLHSLVPYSTTMKELAAQSRLRRHVDMLEAFCDFPIGETMVDWCHCQERGHRLIAGELAPMARELLRQRGASGAGQAGR